MAAALFRARAQDATFSTIVDLVTLLATVRNRDGAIVNNLEQNDFVLEEDGRPQTIRFFARETSAPLTIGLLVDTSRSQLQVLEAERAASYTFLDRVLRENDRAFVASFDTSVQVLVTLTPLRDQLRAALDQLRVPGQVSTLLFDAIDETADDPMRYQKGRKAFILLSDGFDYGSKTSLPAAIESAQRADTLIYSIWYHDKKVPYRPLRAGLQTYTEGKGKAVMERLSRETGGRFFEVSKKLSIENIYRQIEEELRSQYRFAYTSDHVGSDQEYRKIRLTTKRPGLIVQTREGYYPQ
jgi:VWFA-related protein